ncbi:hypothetical protein KQI84_09460 [bacterium]|nr:hypothetical protein [bacterium]
MTMKHARIWILMLVAACALTAGPALAQKQPTGGAQREPVQKQPQQTNNRQQSSGASNTNNRRPSRQPRTGSGARPEAGGRTGSSTGRSGASSASSLGGVQMVSNPDNLILRLTAANAEGFEDVDAVEGGTFGTDIRLDNPRGKPVDSMRLIVDYNPAFISPKSINDTPLKEFLDGAPKATVNRSLGQIYYEANFKEPIPPSDEPIMYLRWEAKTPVVYTAIEFGKNREIGVTDLTYQNESVLGEPHEEGDGTVSVGVRVIPADPDEAALMQEEPQLYLGSDERVGGVQIAIQPPIETPQVGQIFTMDIVLDNSTYSQIDGISFLIQYDPTTIEILDADQDNWITLGPNILDGPFHGDFPFDYHMANTFYQVRGLIEYRVGTSTPDDLLGIDAPIARIVARGLKPSAGTAVQFSFSKRRGTRTTEVVYMGQDVLGDPDISNDGARGAFFRVLPE